MLLARRFVLTALSLLIPGMAVAQTLPPPAGEVVLTVAGAVDRPNAGDVAAFDMAMLAGLPATSFRTTTIWNDGTQWFEGVLLRDLIAAVGARGRTIRAVALNDYAVELPMSDATDGCALVAYARNGAPMTVRAKGPLWIVYNYDSDPKYRTEVIYSRSIWQLARLEIVE